MEYGFTSASNVKRVEQQQQRIINPDIEGVSLRLFWTAVGSTILICATILGIYYDLKENMAVRDKQNEMEIKIINMRLEKLESK